MWFSDWSISAKLFQVSFEDFHAAAVETRKIFFAFESGERSTSLRSGLRKGQSAILKNQ